MTLRICILESDDLHPTMQDSFIGFGQMFKQLFAGQDASVVCQVFNGCEANILRPASNLTLI